MRCKHFILWMLNLHNHFGILVSALMIFFRTMESPPTILLALIGLWDISKKVCVSVIVIIIVVVLLLLLWILFYWCYHIYLDRNCLFNCTVLRLWFMMCRQNGRSYLGILDDVESSFSLLDIPFTDINNIVGSQSYF